MNESLVKPFIRILMNMPLFSMKTAHALPHSLLFCVGGRMSLVVTTESRPALWVLEINLAKSGVECTFIIVDRYRCTRRLI